VSSLAVVILNWNGVDWLKKFLPNVVKYSTSEHTKVVVVDNASTDDSVAYVQQHFSTVQLVINADNGGYAKGYNDGLKHVVADYFVLLNSDVEVTENWLQPLIQLMDEQPKVAACQPKILSYKEPHKFEYAGAAGGFIDKFGYAFCRGRLFDYIEDEEQQYEVSSEIFWATGACMLVRSKVFFEMGGLDEDFFAHQEEIDLCWRMKNAGHKIYYVHNSRVYHVGGGTLSALSSFKTYLNFRNNLFLLYKNLPPKYLLRIIPFRFFLDYLALAKFLFSRQSKHAGAVLKAHLHFLQQFPKVRIKRRKVYFAPDADYTSCVYLKSVVYDYFVAGVKKFSHLNQSKFSK
jgi:GT2 family glycosyltransferase